MHKITPEFFSPSSVQSFKALFQRCFGAFTDSTEHDSSHGTSNFQCFNGCSEACTSSSTSRLPQTAAATTGALHGDSMSKCNVADPLRELQLREILLQAILPLDKNAILQRYSFSNSRRAYGCYPGSFSLRCAVVPERRTLDL